MPRSTPCAWSRSSGPPSAWRTWEEAPVVDPESALPRSLSLPPDVDLLAGRLRLVIVALLAGLTGALVLLGVPMPAGTLPLAATHGVLMTLGFLGTLIALERAVALGRSWGYAAPVGAGLGAMALVLGLPVALGAALLVVGGAAFVGMYVAFDRIEAAFHTRVQAVGAAAWLVAALLWLVCVVVLFGLCFWLWFVLVGVLFVLVLGFVCCCVFLCFFFFLTCFFC